MKRELIIAAAVLVPFGALVVAGFWFSPEGQPLMPGEVEAPFIPSEVEGPPARSPLDSARGERSVFDAGAAFPPALQAPLTAVLPEVKRCFADQRLERTHEVRVRFTPTRDGGFDRVEVDEQNPYLQACLEDVFAEVSWHPSGPETYTPAEHTFSFGPSSD